MTPHERDLILKVADEVRAADRTAVDRDAEQLIRTEVAAQSHAAYILTQRVIVQDLAVQQAQTRIAELESRLRQIGAPVGGTGDPAGAGAPPAGARSGVGDFLKTAAAAAAGTIGGQLIYDGLRHWAAEHGGIGTGFLGGLGGGGYAPSGGGREDVVSDAETETPDRGGGGDWGDDPVEGEEATDDEGDADDESDGDSGGGGDWGDDGANGDDSTGGSGGDW